MTATIIILALAAAAWLAFLAYGFLAIWDFFTFNARDDE